MNLPKRESQSLILFLRILNREEVAKAEAEVAVKETFYRGL